jgi:hypothetical protein
VRLSQVFDFAAELLLRDEFVVDRSDRSRVEHRAFILLRCEARRTQALDRALDSRGDERIDFDIQRRTRRVQEWAGVDFGATYTTSERADSY